MARIAVNFTFHAGVIRPVFQNVRLIGSWNDHGLFSDQWSSTAMAASTDETGCPAFVAGVQLDDSQVGAAFHWGVMADTPGTPNRWIVVTEVPDANSSERHRSFTLNAGGQDEHYWFATGRRYGAQKFYVAGSPDPAIRFSVWAPQRQKGRGGARSGYVKLVHRLHRRRR